MKHNKVKTAVPSTQFVTFIFQKIEYVFDLIILKPMEFKCA